MTAPATRDPNATGDPLAPLSRAERASLTSGADMWCTQPIEHAGISSVRLGDGPHGLRRQPDDGDHLGIGHSLPATCFPPAVALGSSWDRDLVRRVGEALGREARSLGVQVLLGPGVNIKRSPLGGRNFEYFSEDPHLTGRLGAAYVQGVQSQGVGTALKHFAVHNQETDRMRVDVDVDERTLREIYLAAFEHVVTTAHPRLVMSAYNRINGTFAAEHRWLLTDVLRGEWGFDGVVVSDWGGVDDRVAALQAGLDLEMPSSGGLGDAELLAAIESGQLAPELVDASARRMLELVPAAHDVSSTGDDAANGGDDADAHHDLAREAAGQCVVLLKNDDALPLNPKHSVAVVGELARTPRIQGGGSSHVVPTRVAQPLDELRKLAQETVPFAPGYSIDAVDSDPDVVNEATALAAAADVTVVFLGLPEIDESEGYDRTHLDLPAVQLELLTAVAGTGTTVVVVLSNGGVVRMSDWDHLADAIVEGWLLGQAGGGGVADVLFGAADPGGRLAETIPVRLADTPSYLTFPGELGTVTYGEGVFVGYRHHDAVEGPVSYPFGHGLSYADFAYRDLTVSAHGHDESLRVDVSVRVTNTSNRPGSEVVQLYVAATSDVVRRPVRELRGFDKVWLAPGEATTVSFPLSYRDFAYFHARQRRWVVEPGPVAVQVGASSRDIRQSETVALNTNSLNPTDPTGCLLRPDSTLAEWQAAPGGLDALRRAGLAGSRFLTDDGLRTLGSVPVRRLARLPGNDLDPAQIDRLAAHLNRRIETESNEEDSP